MFSRLFPIVPALISVVNAFANPDACTGDCFGRDPSLIQGPGGDWFLFNTGNGIGIWKADNISGDWAYVCDTLPGGSIINITGADNLWAPDVSLVGSTYYMYYSASTSGSQDSAIGVATSETMECGSWTDHGSIGIISSSAKPYNAIDPNLIKVGNSYALNFGSFWNDIFQVPMSATPTSISGTASYNLAYNSTGTHSEEGSYMFYHSGYYYLLFSSGICCDFDTTIPPTGGEYKIMMCRSESSNSGFVDENGTPCISSGGTVLLASHDDVYAPGGEGVYLTADGPLLYYHYVKPSVSLTEYYFGFNYLTFTNGWPSV